jgi:hypothetical protein
LCQADAIALGNFPGRHGILRGHGGMTLKPGRGPRQLEQSPEVRIELVEQIVVDQV